jgi:hypothetical protein
MKAQRRNRQSGTVMVEAIIAISMIIVMFAGVVYFHNAYDAKARVLRDARMQAWRATDVACEGGGKGSASLAALIPTPYARTAGASLSVSSRDEMKCNERHDERKTVTGLLAWSGLKDKLANYGSLLLEAFKF